MPKRILSLTDTQIKALKPKDKTYKLFDGKGLFLSIPPSGQKRWRLKYRFDGKEKLISLGVYPDTSLSNAREKREAFKKMIANGIDPSSERQKDKEQIKKEEITKENTFYNISQKWWENYRDQVSEDYHIRLGRALENYIYPTIKNKPIDEVTRLDIIAIMEDLKKREIHETARRTTMLLNKVFKYAVTHEYTPHNIIADIEIKDILGKKVIHHYPSLSKEADIKALLLSIDGYSGAYFTIMALKVLPYVFVRSGNLRHMKWEEIDFKNKEWVIPADKMKIKIEFTLPLPHQVITLLEELQTNSLSTKYVFPSPIYKDRPLSNNTLSSALRRMGYTKKELVPNSFRPIFSTVSYEWANKEDGHGYTGEVIEACLAHKETNKVKEAYNRSNYKEAKRGLVQWYADYLDKLLSNN